MVDNWTQTTIGELYEAIYDGPHATPKKTLEGPIFLGISNLQNGRIDLTNVDHLSEDDYIRWTRRVTPQPGDVVFSYETRLGEAAIIPEGLRCCLGRRMALMRPDRAKVEPRFLLFAYLSPAFQEVIRRRTVPGSTVDRILLTELPSFPISLPPLEEQRAIAHILGTLDDKIELNRQMNRTLDEIARTLFTSWFVNFDPVRAKAQGRELEGMDVETATLFPDRFVDSALGPIPEGWEVRALRDITTTVRRGISPIYIDGGGVLVLNQKCIRDGLIETDRGRRHDPAQRSIVGRQLEVGDILVNSTGVGTLGRVAQVLRLPEETICDSHVTVVRADQQVVSPNILGLALLLRQSEIEALGHGSTGQTELSRSALSEMMFAVPPVNLGWKFDELVTPLRSLIAENHEESRTLATLRDTLLPRLISGGPTLQTTRQEGLL